MARTSFLLPVRDAASTLHEALASVCAQTDPDFEVVVVDDGSSDDSAAIAEAFPDPRVRVLRRPAEGLVAALDAGLEVCRGTWIARMDADDVAAPQRLERQIPLLLADDTLAVVDGRVRFVRDEGTVPGGMRRYAQWVNSVVEPGDFDREILVESPVVHPAATIRRRALQAVGGYRDGPFPEDQDLWLRLHATGWRLRKVPEVLVTMRDRPDRLTRTDARYARDGFRQVKQQWLQRRVLERPRRVVLWATHKERRAWLRWLLDAGHEVVALIDVDPAQIGRHKQGVPVVGVDDLPDLDVEIALVAVRPAREGCRQVIAEHRPDLVEGRDWWCVA